MVVGVVVMVVGSSPPLFAMQGEIECVAPDFPPLEIRPSIKGRLIKSSMQSHMFPYR